MTDNSEHKKLWHIFHEFDEFVLISNPERATIEGDHRFDDRLSDYSEEYLKIIYGTNRRFLKDISSINYGKLDEQDKINYDLFKYYTELEIEAEKFSFHYMPVWQQNGIHIDITRLAEFHPCNTNIDALNFLKRINSDEQRTGH